MIAVPGEEEIIGGESSGPAGGVELLLHRDIGIARRGKARGVRRPALLNHRRGVICAAPCQREASEEEKGQAARHVLTVRG